MNIRPSTRRKAVLGIYRIRRKRKGGRLSASELERAWHPTTGLRRADLQLALADMVEHQLLVSHVTANGLVYELTYLGERAMHSAVAHGAIEDFADWITLLRARMRRAKRPMSGPRRSSDVSATAH
jgi:hypothetical protein